MYNLCALLKPVGRSFFFDYSCFFEIYALFGTMTLFRFYSLYDYAFFHDDVYKCIFHKHVIQETNLSVTMNISV